jgi:uncharacterized membrane protein required for colicin V production
VSALLPHPVPLCFLAAAAPAGGTPGAGSWQAAFGLGAIIVVILQAWRGWRSGIIRQIMEIVAVACAYAAAYFGAPLGAPFLRPLGYPNPILSVLGGSIVAIAVFAIVSIGSVILFKKTSQQSLGLVRLGYGLSGAALGALFGVVCIWVIVLAIRVVGTLAETKIQNPSNPFQTRDVRSGHSPAAANPAWILGLVQMKRSLEEGNTGSLVRQVDPVPTKIYALVGKLGTVLGNQQNVDRFLSYPGVKPLTENPKILALREDEELVRAAQSWDWSALLHNPRVIQAANDPDVSAMVRKVDLEKALDYALAHPQNGR